MTRHLLVCTGVLLCVLLVACAGDDDQRTAMRDTTDAPDSEPTQTTPANTAAPLPTTVAQSVLGDHLEDWFVWLEMPWDQPFLPRCDQLAGSEEPCARARALATSAQAGELAVLGPYELREPSLELLVQGLSQLVMTFPDEETAQQMAAVLREVVVGWGADARDLSFADTAWTADHVDTAPGGFAEIDPDVVTRMVALQQGPTVVVLTHAEDPGSPRLDTEPVAHDIAQRLADDE
ncbi:hypothetical protein BH23ACT9_BH23ACT9_33880 [soil metagenome]